MDAQSHEASIQTVYGMVQGEGNIININPPAPSPAVSSYKGIFGSPPLIDARAIEQRDILVNSLLARLIQSGLNALVLTGIGGVGKSTLAALLYHRIENEKALFSAPPLWLSIDATTTFADLLGTIFQALNAPLPPLASLSPANQAYALFNALATTSAPRLIVLDQFEYFLDWKSGAVLPDRPAMGEWLDALNSQPWTSKCRLLLTSRPRPRGIRQGAEISLQEYPIDGLTVNEGIDLFHRRGVQAADADFQKAVNFCNGHALSLTLLIALVQDYGLPLVDLLADPTLWEGDIATNLLDTVFERLNEVQRALLCSFSVYRTPTSIEAARAVSNKILNGQILPDLRALIMQHLVQPAGEGRYQLHAIVASYARQHFVGGDEQANQQAVQQAHAQAAGYYVQQAAKACPPREQRQRVSDVQFWIEAVWQFCQGAQQQEAYALTIQENLLIDLRRWGGNPILVEVCQLLLPQGTWQPEPLQLAEIALVLASAYDVLGQKEQALLYYGQARTIFQEEHVRDGEGTILNNLGQLSFSQGKMQEAQDYYQQALVIKREVGDRSTEGTILNNLGQLNYSQGKMQEAQDYYQQALVIKREVGDRSTEGTILNNLGLLSFSQGKMQEAQDYYQQALVIKREVGDRSAEGMILNNLGALFFQQQRYNAALTALLLSRQRLEEVHSPNSDIVQNGINALLQVLGEEQFAALQTQVETQGQHLLELALHERLE